MENLIRDHSTNICGSLNFKRNFPAKSFSIGSKVNFDLLVYLIFCYIVNNEMMCLDRPASIIEFARKSEKLHLKVKDPQMLEYTVFKNVTNKLNAL